MANDHNEQDGNIDRVRSKIASTMIAFFRLVGLRGEFHVDELRVYVDHFYACAPDSAGRIMRDLRTRKAINYEVVDRRASLYRVTGVGA